jgi:large subunit ribosomal protein L31
VNSLIANYVLYLLPFVEGHGEQFTHMKQGIHPTYKTVQFACACGNSFAAGSTVSDDVRVEICAMCHPLYTGKSNLIDTAGRLDKFAARQKKAAELQTKKKVAPQTESN